MSVDPTRVDVSLDPRTHRFEGVAFHGNTPFSCSLISQITDDLWQGGCVDGLQLPRDVVHLVSLYPWENYRVHPDVRTVLEVTMYDAEDQGFEQVERIARWVNECRKDGVTLVHCQAGLNRSSLVAARALMLEGMSATDAIALLRKRRSPAVLCNRAFERYLLSLDG